MSVKAIVIAGLKCPPDVGAHTYGVKSVSATSWRSCWEERRTMRANKIPNAYAVPIWNREPRPFNCAVFASR